jgi:hypothetical protein
VATAAGALIEAEPAVALGVVASVAILLLTPNGVAKRRELERQIDRNGEERRDRHPGDLQVRPRRAGSPRVIR